MARGRFISRTITADREVNQLSSDTCRLAFTWLITLADREGRTTGDPDLLAALLFPRRRDISPETVEGFIREWAEAGFVAWYQAPNGDRCIQLVNFYKHQVGMRPEREQKSDFPDPHDCRMIAGVVPESVRSNSGVTPDEVKGEVKGEVEVEGEVEGEGQGEGQTAADSAAAVVSERPRTVPRCFQVYAENISDLNPEVRIELYKALAEFGDEAVVRAIKTAAAASVRHWSYVRGVLQAMRRGNASPPYRR